MLWAAPAASHSRMIDPRQSTQVPNTSKTRARTESLSTMTENATRSRVQTIRGFIQQRGAFGIFKPYISSNGTQAAQLPGRTARARARLRWLDGRQSPGAGA